MSKEREFIKKNYSMDEEEETYNNLESIQGMMKEVKQEYPKEEISPRYSEVEDNFNEDREIPSSHSEDEKRKKTKKKKLKKRKIEESEDFDYEDLKEDHEEKPVLKSDDEISDYDRKFTKKKRQRSKKPKTKKKKKGIRGGIDEFIEREAESEYEEESEEDIGEITKEQQDKYLKEIYARRDNRGDVSLPSRKRLELLDQ